MACDFTLIKAAIILLAASAGRDYDLIVMTNEQGGLAMWRELFPKVLKWNISALFLILGLYFIFLVDRGGHIGPLILAIFSFGIVYWLYKTSGFSRQTAAVSALVLVASWAAARYLALDGGIFSMGFYADWIVWNLLLGTPSMTFAYLKFK